MNGEVQKRAVPLTDQELAEAEDDALVCLAHLRFLPCRQCQSYRMWDTVTWYSKDDCCVQVVHHFQRDWITEEVARDHIRSSHIPGN